MGRQKYVVELYRGLHKSAADKAWAEAVFKKARNRYHPATQKSVAKAMEG
ncbi:leukotriene A4 hydrolase C-terminal domain-containing protein [Massilia sp. B-10]|nr:leukotriene A4 hydrolase C-terminal domain-containing protein [Massilia sp. B-10]